MNLAISILIFYLTIFYDFAYIYFNNLPIDILIFYPILFYEFTLI